MTEAPSPHPTAEPFRSAVVAYAQAGWPCILPVPPREPLPVLPVAEPVALYRHVDRRGELLYVGITSDPGRRWLQHMESSLWARFVATTFVQWFTDRRTARRSEQEAIRSEAPIFNSSRPRGCPIGTDKKLAYLRTGTADVVRRVPCRHVVGDFCASCGPDAERWFEEMHQRVMAEIGAKAC